MKDFLKGFNISQDEYEKRDLDWKDLMKIKSDYESLCPNLELPAKYLVDTFHKVEKVHSVRYRIKSPEKLIAKIIRKKIKAPSRVINLENYHSEITDLIGLRILHLFKENWEIIHKFITENWELYEEPIAYYREGDSEDYVKNFVNFKCRVEKHPYGYRSVHYLIKTKPNKNTYIAEIQVRTIFEEAWSEIDHTVRYPHQLSNPLLNQFLVLFNRLAGSADEMGSFVLRLKLQLALNEQEYQASIAKKTQIIEKLKQEINELRLKPKLASEFDSNLNEILKMPNYTPAPFNFNAIEPKLPDFSNILGLNDTDFSKILGNSTTDIAKILGDIDWSQIVLSKIEKKDNK